MNSPMFLGRLLLYLRAKKTTLGTGNDMAVFKLDAVACPVRTAVEGEIRRSLRNSRLSIPKLSPDGVQA